MPANHLNSGIPASCFINVKRDAPIDSFATARAFLEYEKGTQLNKGDEATIGVSSKVLKLRVLSMVAQHPTEIGVVLYDTVIIAYRNDETFTVNSGGYLTPTTVTRLNQFSPKPYQRRFCRDDRMLKVGGYYADQHVNRFNVHEVAVVGQLSKPPLLKRGRAKSAHGTLRWMIDRDDNMIVSLNDNHRGEAVYPNEDGELVREVVTNLQGYVGLAKSDVPLDVANRHRRMWGMPVMELLPS